MNTPAEAGDWIQLRSEQTATPRGTRRGLGFRHSVVQQRAWSGWHDETMLHGDDAPTSIEVVKLARRQASRPGQQKAARPRRRQPTLSLGLGVVASGPKRTAPRVAPAMLLIGDRG